jgi:putative endonuclease
MNPALPKSRFRKSWVNPAPPNYCVYILKSEKSKWLYIGYTSDLKKRLSEHKAGKSFSTKRYIPIRLVYYETYTSKIDAIEREKQLKNYGSSLQKLKQRIKNSLGGAG